MFLNLQTLGNGIEFCFDASKEGELVVSYIATVLYTVNFTISILSDIALPFLLSNLPDFFAFNVN